MKSEEQPATLQLCVDAGAPALVSAPRETDHGSAVITGPAAAHNLCRPQRSSVSRSCTRSNKATAGGLYGDIWPYRDPQRGLWKEPCSASFPSPAGINWKSPGVVENILHFR